ncbi:MAG: DUF2070 family protein [Methanosphaera stadtmanae]|nr:DUF2070 family protein [Methanosphaera stadtmanae]
MSVTDRVVKMSKYMITLPKSRISLLLILIVSIFFGGIIGCLTPDLQFEGIAYAFLDGAATLFFLLALPTIAYGGIMHSAVNSLKKRHMKLKQALFLSFISMTIIALIYLVGHIILAVLGLDYTMNFLLIGILFGFGIIMLILWGTSNIKFWQSFIIAALQPVLILSMLVLIYYLTETTTSANSVIFMYIKAIIGALVLALAVYAFVTVIESPIRNNLGVGGLELLSLFIANMTEGSNAMEDLFAVMGEPVDTTVGVVSFKNKEGIKANYISPCVHPGPVGSIGGGNLPEVLNNQLDDFSIIVHGAATHDFNPVAAKEIKKIADAVDNLIPTLEYSDKASKFQRVQHDEAKIGLQQFNDGAILLSTFAPIPGDDIDYGVGVSMMYETKYQLNLNDVIVVDCHNCLSGNIDRLMPGHNRVIQIEDAIKKLEKPELYPIEMGCASKIIEDITVKEGVGPCGLKLMITKVDNQEMLYVVVDGNNMKQGFREEIMDAVHEKYPEIDMIEVMTTDTHIVNTISGGGLTVGTKKGDILINHILNLIPEAYDDLEEVSVASGTARLNIETLGPNNSTELVTTLSSIFSVMKLLAPLVFITAAIILIWWIF